MELPSTPRVLGRSYYRRSELDGAVWVAWRRETAGGTPRRRVDWAAKVEKRYVVRAALLEAANDSGRTLASGARGEAFKLGADGTTAPSTGAFGEVSKFLFSGTPVAVKELCSTVVDSTTIGEDLCVRCDACQAG